MEANQIPMCKGKGGKRGMKGRRMHFFPSQPCATEGRLNEL